MHAVIDTIADRARAKQMAARTARSAMTSTISQRRFDRGGHLLAAASARSSRYNGSGDFASASASQWYQLAPPTATSCSATTPTPAAAGTSGSDGRWYGVMIFVKLCGAAPPPVTYGGFTDIADSKFRDDIVWLAERGITTGCAETRFCPDRAGASRPDGDAS